MSRNLHAIVAVLLFAGLALSSLYSYLLFHTLAELFAIVIACAIFVIAWNARRFLGNDYLLFVGIAYLAVGALDLVHALAYRGMAVFPGADTNPATQVWLAARTVESVSLLVAPVFFRRSLRPGAALAAFGLVVAALLALVATGAFPLAFAEGVGLTPFKTVGEYGVALLLVGAGLHLWSHRDRCDPAVLRWLLGSIGLTVASELAFTLYADAYGLLNQAGHLLKVVSFYFVYRALVVTGLRHPVDLLFHEVKENERRYRSLFTHMVDGFAYHEVVRDPSGRVVDYVFREVNDAFLALTGATRSALIGRRVTEAFPGIEADPADWIGTYGRVVDTGEPVRFERRSEPLGRWYSVAAYRPEPERFVAVFEDITARKEAERRLRESEERLRAAMRVGRSFAFEWVPETDVVIRTAETGPILGLADAAATHDTGTGFLARVHPADRERAVATVRRLTPTAPAGTGTFRLVRPDGAEVVLEVSVWGTFDADGRLARLVGMAADVTRRERAEAALRELNALLESRVAERTARVRALALQLTEAEIRERERIAAVLHDHHQQLLAGARMAIASLRRNLRDHPALATAAASAEELLTQAITSSRTLSHDLSPPVLRQKGLAPALDWLADEMRTRHGLRVRIHANGDGGELSEPVRVFVFQAARELLFNVVKHAGVDEATIALERVGRALRLTVADEGRGFDAGAAGEGVPGLGLAAIRERMALLGGGLEVDGSPGRGARFRLVVPIAAPSGRAAAVAQPDAHGPPR